MAKPRVRVACAFSRPFFLYQALPSRFDTGVRGGPELKDIHLENRGREIPEA